MCELTARQAHAARATSLPRPRLPRRPPPGAPGPPFPRLAAGRLPGSGRRAGVPVRAGHQRHPAQQLTPPSGTFTVRAALLPGRLRVEVEDQGGPWLPGTDGDCQRGRGLQIVSALATGWHIADDGTGRTTCFHIDLP